MKSALCLALACCGLLNAAQDSALIQLPKPRMDGGMPLMQALKNRKSGREFSSKPIPRQELSNLLWAAFGVNRPESGKRTAPSAMNKQEIDLYVALAEGLFVYDAKANALKKVSGSDLRALTGKQAFVKDAALNIVFVADMSKSKGEDAKVYAAADAGFIAENVYLYCASSGFSTVVRGNVDKEALGKAMGLRPDQTIIFAQTVGYPKSAE